MAEKSAVQSGGEESAENKASVAAPHPKVRMVLGYGGVGLGVRVAVRLIAWGRLSITSQSKDPCSQALLSAL